MNKVSLGFTLIEILTVIAIIMLLGCALCFAILPAIRESGTKTTCASNMAQMVHSAHLYAADNDEVLPYEGPTSPQSVRYIKATPWDLFCPKYRRFKGVPMTTYIDEVVRYHLCRQMQPQPSRTLLNGMMSPDFDPSTDSLIKCNQHGSGTYQPLDMFGTAYSEPNIRGKVLSAYYDGSVRYAPIAPCWEIPWEPNTPQLTILLIRNCDGHLEGSNESK